MMQSASDSAGAQPRTLRDQKRDLTRRRILDAAHRAFTEGDVATATLDQIARDAGVSRATLYLHFANKEAILAELLERDLHHVRTTFESLPRAVQAGPDKVRAWLRAHVDQHRQHQANLRLFSIAAATDPAANAIVSDHLVQVAVILLAPADTSMRTTDPALWTRVILLIARINQVVAALAKSDPQVDEETALDVVAAEIMAVLGQR